MVLGRRLTLLAALLLVALPGPGRADDPPRLSGSLVSYVENDWYARSTNKQLELNDLYLSSNLYTALRLDERFTVNGELKLDVVRSAGDDRYFADEGVWLRQLTLDYKDGNLGLFAGKHTLPFGQAFDLAPGIYGAGFSDDYKLVEHLSIGGKLDLAPNALGLTAVNTEVFMFDSTGLSTAVGARAPFTAADVIRVNRVRRSHGGAGNTDDLSSALIGVEGKASETGWAATLLHRRDGVGGTDPERGVALTLLPPERSIGDWRLDTIAEAVQLWNYNGDSDDQRYLTAGARASRGGFFVTALGGLREVDRPTGGDDSDHLLTASTGYDFPGGISLESGWLRSRQANVRTDVLGLLLTITRSF